MPPLRRAWKRKLTGEAWRCGRRHGAGMGHSSEEVAAAGAIPPEGVAGSPERNAQVGQHPELVRSAFLIGSGVFATTLAQPAVIKLPLQNLLKTDLHVAPEGMAVFFAVSALAWYFKPLAGILSDSFPLFGTRRRHYLLFSATTAAVLWLLVGLVPRSYGSLLGAVVAMNAMLVMGSTVVGGLLVEAGQRYGATGRLTSARYFVMNVCLLLGGPLGGFPHLLHRDHPIEGVRLQAKPAGLPLRGRILKAEPCELLMVSSNSFDVVGARASGYRGGYVNRYDLPYDETPYRFDIEARDFLDLAGKLGCK